MSLLYSSWTCFKEKTKEGGSQRDIVCYSHDKPRHTARVVQIMEGKMVSIRCAHRDIALYLLAEVNMEVHSNMEGVFSVVI